MFQNIKMNQNTWFEDIVLMCSNNKKNLSPEFFSIGYKWALKTQ